MKSDIAMASWTFNGMVSCPLIHSLVHTQHVYGYQVSIAASVKVTRWHGSKLRCRQSDKQQSGKADIQRLGVMLSASGLGVGAFRMSVCMSYIQVII